MPFFDKKTNKFVNYTKELNLENIKKSIQVRREKKERGELPKKKKRTLSQVNKDLLSFTKKEQFSKEFVEFILDDISKRTEINEAEDVLHTSASLILFLNNKFQEEKGKPFTKFDVDSYRRDGRIPPKYGGNLLSVMLNVGGINIFKLSPIQDLRSGNGKVRRKPIIKISK